MGADKQIDEFDGEEITNLEKELWEISNEIFDEEIWSKRAKEEVKDLSKRELSRTMFGFGFIMHQKLMDEEIKDMETEMLKDPDLSKSIESFKKKVNRYKNE